MPGGGGSDTVTQTTRSEPPPQLAPYLAPFMQQASSVAMTPYQPYPGQQVAGFTPMQQQGFDMLSGNAATGNTAINGALSGLQGIAGSTTNVGTNPMMGMDNPYLNQAIGAAQGDVTRNFNNSVANTTDATMARSGAFGGSAWQQAQQNNQHQFTNDLGNISNTMRMGDYANQQQLQENALNRSVSAQQGDRSAQLAALGMIPGMTQAGAANANTLLTAGGTQQQQQQNELSTAYQNWLDQQNYPTKSLGTMASAIGTIMGAGGTNTSTGPNSNQTNSTAAGLGGALGGAGLGASLFPAIAGATPWGAIGGAGLGLLGGMLG